MPLPRPAHAPTPEKHHAPTPETGPRRRPPAPLPGRDLHADVVVHERTERRKILHAEGKGRVRHAPWAIQGPAGDGSRARRAAFHATVLPPPPPPPPPRRPSPGPCCGKQGCEETPGRQTAGPAHHALASHDARAAGAAQGGFPARHVLLPPRQLLFPPCQVGGRAGAVGCDGRRCREGCCCGRAGVLAAASAEGAKQARALGGGRGGGLLHLQRHHGRRGGVAPCPGGGRACRVYIICLGGSEWVGAGAVAPTAACHAACTQRAATDGLHGQRCAQSGALGERCAHHRCSRGYSTGCMLSWQRSGAVRAQIKLN